MSEPQLQFSNSDLNQLRQQLEAWRRTRVAGAALPERLWRAAATLAKAHRPERVGRLLRLNFHNLRESLRPLKRPAKKSSPLLRRSFLCALRALRGKNIGREVRRERKETA